jgi:hypothetical protein
MVMILRTLAIAVAVPAIVAIALAGTAHADPPLLNGTYSERDGDPMSVWTIATSCLPAGCTGTVESNKGWTSPATLTGGQWTFTVTKPQGLICDDGHYEPAVISMSINPSTLGGLLSSDSNFGCAGGTLTQTPFQLRRVG